MQNPWLQLPVTPPFVLHDDRAAIAAHNAAARPEHRFDLSVLPEPFIGSPVAPVVLLNLNPGMDLRDHALHAQPSFAEAVRRNLSHAASDVPFYLLDPAFDGPGRAWWASHLRELIAATSLRDVATRVLCIELVGYHSSKFKAPASPLASQAYSAHLVEAAMARDAIIVFLRGRSHWERLLPQLRSYPRAFRVSSTQSAHVSPRNCPGFFATLVAQIRA
jgi:hypothetical protein